MQRSKFLKTLAILPFIPKSMSVHSLLNSFDTQNFVMPTLFLGHGSPMNAIEENEFVQGFRNISKAIHTPKAILCISAHWETQGTQVTAMDMPTTIHDFGGFPEALYKVEYPAPGSPELATEIKKIINDRPIALDYKWGLDHGAWSVIKHLYPNANIPVIQMSLDYTQTPAQHYQLAKELAVLRSKGVLIIGSGNMVHNLGKIAWDKMNADNYAYDWTIEASIKMKSFINTDNHEALINFDKQGSAFKLAIPSAEHFLPLLYVLALKGKNEKVEFFNDKAVAGSLTMTSLKIN